MRGRSQRALGRRVARRFCLVLGAAILVAGCATAPPDDADLEAGFEPINDPIEGFNRHMFSINNAADAVVLKPISTLYRDWFPPPLQTNVRNLLNFASSPLILIHDLLQADWQRAETTLARFVINIQTFGLGDLAADLGKPYHSEDAGQTLAVWGIENGGPYLVLPLIGPSNVRDAIGTGIDFLLDPLGIVTEAEVCVGRTFGGAVDFRARNMEEIDDLQQTSLDYYAAVRSLYRQRREVEIQKGEIDELRPSPRHLRRI